MSHPEEMDPHHQHEEEDEQDHELNEDDVVEVVEDEGDEPMDDDDEDNDKYDGEIVIGAPMPGEEEELEQMEQMMEDNTLGMTCKLYHRLIQ
jgi:ribosome assembly protein SQT1